MVRLIAISALVLSAGALLAAGLKLKTSLTAPDVIAEQPGSIVLPVQEVTEDAQTPRQFAPVFGRKSEATNDATAAGSPPDAYDFAYRLKGLIVSGEMRWAILADNNQEHILREGETLDGATLSKIHSDSVSVDLGSRTVELAFNPDQRIELAQSPDPETSKSEAMFASAAALWGAQPIEVMYQGMPEQDLVTLLENARERRNRQGWIR